MSDVGHVARAARERVVVVGGGPAGLAVAAVLKAKGIDALVLEKAEEIGASWKAHYDRLHLHTVRWLSGLPYTHIRRGEGRWVARDGVVRYLENYAVRHQLRVRLGVEVISVHRAGAAWTVETDDGPLQADAVALATGYNRDPVIPDWRGAAGFHGELLHSSAYRTGAVYKGRDVLVVGAGNSGAEIAVDLLENGARTVWLSVRTPPNILRRQLAGIPTQVIGVLLRKLPVGAVDRIAGATQRITVGDLSRYGMPSPKRGLYTRVLNEERIPILDVGLIRALKKGKIRVVPAVQHFAQGEVSLEGGQRVTPDAVIAATGFRRGLEPLVGHLGVLNGKGNPTVHGDVTHPRAPNLYFIGYSNPISGNLRELGIDARRIARAVMNG
ncbi:MAG: flavin-containing monooxygenase [Actinomycetota bacterium]